MLTPEQIDMLNAPFDDVRDYGVVNGKPYIRKEAIKRRLTAVDPGWSISEPKFVTRDGDVVFYTATLTVGGVSRAGLGSGIINSTRKVKRKDAKGVVVKDEYGKEIEDIVAVDGYDLALEIRKAHKGAAMDCLARAAVFFMRGLDDLREKVNDANAEGIIKAFLKKHAPSTPQTSGGSRPPQRPSSEDLRDKDVASRFIQRWRGQSLSDTDVLAALGVAKLSEWAKGRAAADEAVNSWLAAKLAQESA